MKTIRYFSLMVVVVTLFASCNKDLLNENPPHFTTVDKIYTSAGGFQSGLNALCSSVRKDREGLKTTGGVGWQYQVGLPLTVGLDDVSTGGNTSGAPAEIIAKSEQMNVPSGEFVKKVYPWLYNIINAANTIIIRAESSKANSYNWNIAGVNQRNRIIGEAYVFRAWAYRILMAYWGDVPLNLQESSGSNVKYDWVRTPQREIRLKLVEDLEKAAEYIPWQPFTAGSMTKGVALHYLAETYLALCVDDTDNAAQYASQAERFSSLLIGDVVDAEDAARFGATDRSLMGDYAAMFKPTNVDYATNTETLWTLQWALNIVGGGDNMMRHTFSTYYPGARVGFGSQNYYNGGTMNIKATFDRGSWGWCQAYITPRVMELYYKSTTTTPYADQTDATWKKFKYEDRGGDKSIAKYFIFNAGDDVITNKELINPETGAKWATGDTVWFASNTRTDAIKKNAYGIAYQNIGATSKFGNRYNYIYTLKFKYSDSGYETATASHFNQMYLRLGETYLVRAEARVRLNNLDGAASDINVLRNRAHARTVASGDFGSTLQSQLDFVLDERTRELLCEEHRRVTLTRMGRKDFLWRRIQRYNLKDADNFRKNDIFFAIPGTVIDVNTVPFPQNPGILGGPAVDASGWPEQPPKWTFDNN